MRFRQRLCEYALKHGVTKVFTSEKELIKAVEKHMKRYNFTAKTSLNFKSLNEVVSKYFSKCNICLDN